MEAVVSYKTTANYSYYFLYLSI